MYTNKTQYYKLPQYLSTDVPDILHDFNNAMAKIDEALHEASQGGGSSIRDAISYHDVLPDSGYYTSLTSGSFTNGSGEPITVIPSGIYLIIPTTLMNADLVDPNNHANYSFDFNIGTVNGMTVDSVIKFSNIGNGLNVNVAYIETDYNLDTAKQRHTWYNMVDGNTSYSETVISFIMLPIN